MSFSTISNTVPSAVTFNQAGTGKYIATTMTYGGPQNFYLLSPARNIKPLAGGARAKSIGISRYTEADVVINGVTVRLGCRARVILEIDEGCPLSSADSILRQIDEFTTETNLNRMLAGEV